MFLKLMLNNILSQDRNEHEPHMKVYHLGKLFPSKTNHLIYDMEILDITNSWRVPLPKWLCVIIIKTRFLLNLHEFSIIAMYNNKYKVFSYFDFFTKLRSTTLQVKPHALFQNSYLEPKTLLQCYTSTLRLRCFSHWWWLDLLAPYWPLWNSQTSKSLL